MGLDTYFSAQNKKTNQALAVELRMDYSKMLAKAFWRSFKN